MSKPPLPANESERLEVLNAYGILDTPPEEQYDALVTLAADICKAPIALISLIDEKRQWFKARHGLKAAATERDIAFCAHAILHPEPLVVEDAQLDPRFVDNPLVVAEPNIRFYAGAPLVTPDGFALGTLCVIDHRARRLAGDHARALQILSRHVMMLLELRRQRRALGQTAVSPDVLDRLGVGPVGVQDQLRDAERAKRALLGVLEDQKQVEERLRVSEERYRLLFEQNPASLLIYERDSLALVAVNEAFCNHYGYSSEEALSLTLTDLHPPEERGPIAELVARLHGFADVGEWHHLRRDGSVITVVSSSHDTRFEGRAARIAVITDITDRKKTEQALGDSERRQRLFIEHAPAALAMFDTEMRHLSVSRRWLSDYGLSEGQVLGHSYYTVFPEIPADWKAVHRRALAGEVVRSQEDRFERHDGKVHWLKWEARPWYGQDGGIGGIVIFSEDISERVMAEQALQRLNEELEDRVAQRTRELEEANRELETFTYSVSHDLKAPLRGIDGYSRLLFEDYGDRLKGEGSEFLRNIQDGVARMAQLIEDLLAYSRMERHSTRITSIDIGGLLTALIAEREVQLGEAGVTVELDVGSVRVEADAEGLRMALRNLIDNGLKFRAAGRPPVIRLSARPIESGVEIAVADNGIGFEMRFHDRIFEIFQRLHRSEEFPGTGIGLAIVRKAMERMGGTVHAVSEPGQGATFVLEIPK